MDERVDLLGAVEVRSRRPARLEPPPLIAIINGMSEEKPPPLVAAEALIEFTETDLFPLDTPFEQILHGTFMRSRDTFKSIYNLLATGFPVQAAMLVRSLFEDMVVAHWLVLNRDDPDWLTGRFRRHRDAMALHQDRLRRETGGWGMGRPLADPEPLRSQQNVLFKEFGGEAKRDWWDPCANGDGTGEPLGLRGIAERLEEAAAGGGLGWLRFAGGREPLLARTELVVHKWMTQFLHHTALGLPFGLTEKGEPEVLHDPSDMVMFTAYWMFGQQVYPFTSSTAATWASSRRSTSATWSAASGTSAGRRTRSSRCPTTRVPTGPGPRARTRRQSRARGASRACTPRRRGRRRVGR